MNSPSELIGQELKLLFARYHIQTADVTLRAVGGNDEMKYSYMRDGVVTTKDGGTKQVSNWIALTQTSVRQCTF